MIAALAIAAHLYNTPVNPAQVGCPQAYIEQVIPNEQGLMALGCFQNVPVDVYPQHGGCTHEDKYVTEVWNVRLHGHLYFLSDTLRQVITICQEGYDYPKEH